MQKLFKVDLPTPNIAKNIDVYSTSAPPHLMSCNVAREWGQTFERAAKLISDAYGEMIDNYCRLAAMFSNDVTIEHYDDRAENNLLDSPGMFGRKTIKVKTPQFREPSEWATVYIEVRSGLYKVKGKLSEFALRMVGEM